ncbi:MAG: phosphohydrolase [Spirochaetia bacterium]|jgi:metal-dependent HD superfamily phosphatase/phosphodiesterase
MKSPKQIGLENEIRGRLSGVARTAADILLDDQEIQHLQEYANVVSIKRLGYNDHGPVHMRTVVLNAIVMAELMHTAGIKLSLEADDAGTYGDSLVGLLLAGMLHDVGMSVGRADHEHDGVWLSLPIMDRVLARVYGDDVGRRVVVRSLAVECIVGHMATQRIHSLEAGLILIADGCDMEKGRARIPMMIATESRVGDIHKYSASAIEQVRIEKGVQRPIRITVEMKATVGFFQVEEVLLHKIDWSPAKPFIELYAGIIDKKLKCYLGCEGHAHAGGNGAPKAKRGAGRS